MQFVKTSISGLYIRDPADLSPGWLGVICNCNESSSDCKDNTMVLSQAWDEADVFVFAPQPPDDLQQFKNHLCEYAPEDLQILLWMEDANNTSQLEKCVQIKVKPEPTKVMKEFYFCPGQQITLKIPEGYVIEVGDSGLVIHRYNPWDLPIVFTPAAHDPVTKVTANLIKLPMSGPASGSLSFKLESSINRFFTDFHKGFRYYYGSQYPAPFCIYPMVDPPDEDDLISLKDNLCFQVALDPNDLCNLKSSGRMLRTYIAFSSEAVLPSFYRTQWGGHIMLSPHIEHVNDIIAQVPLSNCARFVFSPANEKGSASDPLYLVPEGAFHIQLPAMMRNDEPVQVQLLGGLSGVETVELVPAFRKYVGDALVFESMHAAYSTIDPGTASGESPTLTSYYVTSWATVSRLDKQEELKEYPIRYLSQPIEESWFEAHADKLYSRTLYQPTVAILDDSARTFFPHVPLSGITRSNDWKELMLERFVISPTRKQVHDKLFFRQEAMGLLTEPTDKDAVTPQGLLLKAAADGGWSELLLAKNKIGEQIEELKITSVSSVLKAALLTDQLFLIVSLNEHLQGFTENIPIADWPFRIAIPQPPESMSEDHPLRNVLIFKFCHGELKELVKDPSLWTKPNTFNLPDKIKISELSLWLQERCKPGNGLEWFNRALNDPNWNGILAFDVNLIPSSLPRSLKCLMGGVDEEKFLAHHVGFQMNRIKKGTGTVLEMEDISSMFAYINYVNDSMIPVSPVWGDKDYGFQVTKLEVLFENSRINRFDAKLELSLHQLFGIEAKEIKIMKFNGKLEQHNGEPAYVFYSNAPLNIDMKNDILPRIELTKATLETTKDDGTIVEARFAFHGALHFGKFNPDVFSFGGEGSSKLSLSNLGVCMSFKVDSLRIDDDISFRFDAKDVLLDLIQCISRSDSFTSGFPLQLTRLILDASPDRLQQEGFHSISVFFSKPIERQPQVQPEWYGIECSISLGSLGSLSTEDQLVGKVAFCWSNENERHVAIQIPGTKPGAAMLALQQIIDTSFQSIRLGHDNASYSLIFENIAQRFIGQPLGFPAGSDKLVLFKGNGANEPVGWYAAYKPLP